MFDKVTKKDVLYLTIVVFILYNCTVNLESTWGVIQTILKVLQPFAIAVCLAIMINPLYELFCRHFKSHKFCLLATIILATAVLTALVVLFISCYDLVSPLLQNIDNITDTVQNYVQGFIHKNEWINKIVTPTEYSFDNEKLDQLLLSIYSKAQAFSKSLVNFIIGYVVAFFLIWYKEPLLGVTKRILQIALRKRVRLYKLLLSICKEGCTLCNQYVLGKSIDCLIIGVVTFIFCKILKIDTALSIAAVVAIFNYVPVFGPIIGAVPGGAYILMYYPSKFWWYCIFILILQQLDGNIIGPKCLGKCLQVNALLVIFSTVIFGGLFGVFGFVFGIPITVLIIRAITTHTKES